MIQAEKSMALGLFCPGKDQQSVLLFALQSFETLREVVSGCRNTQAWQGKDFGNCGSLVERSASEARVGSSGTRGEMISAASVGIQTQKDGARP